MRVVWALLIAVSLGCANQRALGPAQQSGFDDLRIDKPQQTSIEPADLGTSRLISETAQPPEEIQTAPTELPSELSLDVLEQMALRGNPSLEVARAKIEAARGVWIQAGLRQNPVAGYTADDIGIAGTAGLQGVFVGQKLITGGKRQLRQAAAQGAVMHAQQQWAAQRLRVLTDVRTHFYRALIAQRRFQSAQKLVSIAEKAVEAAEALLQAQEARRIDVLQSNIERDRAKLTLQKTKSQHIAIWRALAAVVGDQDLTRQPLTGDIESELPKLIWDLALQRLLADSPEVAVAVADIEHAQSALRREIAEAKPDVDAEVSIQYDNEVGDTVAGVSVGLPLPIWNSNQGAIQRANAELAAAQSNVRRVEFDLQQRLADTFENYSDARLTAEKYADDILPSAQKTITLVSQGFEAGELPYLDLLTAQRTLSQAELEYMDALERLWSAVQYVEGHLLDDSLAK
jgi:cobalt-zinc-cadmium efflux system outer membrane protein